MQINAGRAGNLVAFSRALNDLRRRHFKIAFPLLRFRGLNNSIKCKLSRPNLGRSHKLPGPVARSSGRLTIYTRMRPPAATRNNHLRLQQKPPATLSSRSSSNKRTPALAINHRTLVRPLPASRRHRAWAPGQLVYINSGARVRPIIS